MSKATPPRTNQPTDTESTDNPTVLVTYQNGSGYRTIRGRDYRINDHGHLIVEDTDGRRHILSDGYEWKVSEVPDE